MQASQMCKYFWAEKGLELFSWIVHIEALFKCIFYYTSPGQHPENIVYISLT